MRVVVGDDGNVGHSGCDFTHQRPLQLITITAAAKYADQPLMLERLQRPQHFFEGIGGMGVVDNHGGLTTRFVRQPDRLDAARGAGPVDDAPVAIPAH